MNKDGFTMFCLQSKLSPLFGLLSCTLLVACSGSGAAMNTSDSTSTQPAITSLIANQPILPELSPAELEKPEEERFALFVTRLQDKAKQQGISQPTIDAAFTNVTLLKRVIASDKNQLEKKITLDDYLKRVLTNSRIVRGREMYQENIEQLTKAAEKSGVPANYIVALWGMESSYGRIQGRENIISAMSSLAFEGRREIFFTNQLMAALQILEEGHIEIDNLKGSWAGAMGQCQFMPGSFIKYGADGDGDGKIDIWNNRADVFASTANYLATEGWDAKLPWGKEITLPAGFDHSLSGLDDDKAKTAVEWKKLGVTLPDMTAHETQQPSWIVLPDDTEGRAFVVYRNFKTLMHWNRSYYFAISVGMLADASLNRSE